MVTNVKAVIGRAMATTMTTEGHGSQGTTITQEVHTLVTKVAVTEATMYIVGITMPVININLKVADTRMGIHTINNSTNSTITNIGVVIVMTDTPILREAIHTNTDPRNVAEMTKVTKTTLVGTTEGDKLMTIIIVSNKNIHSRLLR
jgi:hypothetical protein